MSAVGITPDQWDAYSRGIRSIEKADYGQMGGSSTRFAGAYQMGSAEIARAAKALDEPVPTQREFLNDPSMQDRFFDAFTRLHHDYLMGHSQQYAAMSPEEQLKILGYAHNQGEGGATHYLANGVTGRDAYGTPGTAYVNAVGRELSGGGTVDPDAPHLGAMGAGAAAPQTPQESLAAQLFNLPPDQRNDFLQKKIDEITGRVTGDMGIVTDLRAPEGSIGQGDEDEEEDTGPGTIPERNPHRDPFAAFPVAKDQFAEFPAAPPQTSWLGSAEQAVSNWWNKPSTPASTPTPEPDAVAKAREQYPILKGMDFAATQSPQTAGDDRMLESWQPNDPGWTWGSGNTYYPRPKGIPNDKFGIEILDPKTRPLDVLGDVVSHQLVNTDPKIAGYYQQFKDSLTPEQHAQLQEQYQYAQQNEGETRPYAEWEQASGLPAYFRGYAFDQWPKDFNDKAYTPEQRKMFDDMMSYLKQEPGNLTPAGAQLVSGISQAGDIAAKELNPFALAKGATDIAGRALSAGLTAGKDAAQINTPLGPTPEELQKVPSIDVPDLERPGLTTNTRSAAQFGGQVLDATGRAMDALFTGGLEAFNQFLRDSGVSDTGAQQLMQDAGVLAQGKFGEVGAVADVGRGPGISTPEAISAFRQRVYDGIYKDIYAQEAAGKQGTPLAIEHLAAKPQAAAAEPPQAATTPATPEPETTAQATQPGPQDEDETAILKAAGHSDADIAKMSGSARAQAVWDAFEKGVQPPIYKEQPEGAAARPAPPAPPASLAESPAKQAESSTQTAESAENTQESTLNSKNTPSNTITPVATFETAKGSTYDVHDDGTTTRTKAARAEHPGDEGLKPRSAATYYADENAANRLATPEGKWRIVDHGDGTLSLVTPTKNGGWGAGSLERNVPVSTMPTVGAYPIELWGPEKFTVGGGRVYKEIHPGNAITSISGFDPFAEFPAADQPTAEPVSDLTAQAKDLADPKNPRKAVYLPQSSVAELAQAPEQAKAVLASGVPLADFDGKGGMLITQDQATAQAALKARDGGKDMQAIVGGLVGSGTGKPADGTHVVQQLDAQGNVTRESLVTQADVDQTKKDFASPGRFVRVLNPLQALQRRNALTQTPSAIQLGGHDEFAEFPKVPPLKDLLEREPPPTAQEVFNHPEIVQESQAQRAIAPTDQGEEYGSPGYRANRLFNTTPNGTETVKGYRQGIPLVTARAEQYSTEGPVKNDRKATIIIGSPASGKSTLARTIARESFAAIPDPDDTREFFPEYQGGKGGDATQGESLDATAEVMRRLAMRGANMVIPKTGYSTSGIRRITDRLHAAGYKVDLVNVAVDRDEAARRMAKRYLKNGRLVQPDYMEGTGSHAGPSAGQRATNTYNALKDEGAAERYAELDANKPWPWPILRDGEAVQDLKDYGRPGQKGQASPGQVVAHAEEGQTQQAEAKLKKKPSGVGEELRQLIARNGGINDQTETHKGNLAAMGAPIRKGFQGIINNKTGLHPDEMRRIAAEAGFLKEDLPDRPPESTVDELYDKIERGNGADGEKFYSRFNDKAVADREGKRAEAKSKEEQQRLIDEIEEHGFALDKPGEKERAIELYQEGVPLRLIAEQIANEYADAWDGPAVQQAVEEIPSDANDTGTTRENGASLPEGRAQQAVAGGEAIGGSRRGEAVASAGEVDKGGAEPATGQIITTEATPAGEQTVLPGTEKISDAKLAKRKAKEPLKAKADQKGPESLGGIFGDEGKQTDLTEKAKAGVIPQDGWRDHLVKARDYAKKLGITDKIGEGNWNDKDKIVAAIDAHLKDEQPTTETAETKNETKSIADKATKRLSALGKRLVGKEPGEWRKMAPRLFDFVKKVEAFYGETVTTKSTKESLERLGLYKRAIRELDEKAKEVEQPKAEKAKDIATKAAKRAKAEAKPEEEDERDFSDTGKIGGARKDQWAQRGLDLSDLKDMTGAEKASKVNKGNIFPRPDYADLVANGGVDPQAAHLIKQIYDDIPRKPAKRGYYDAPTAEHFIMALRALRSILSEVKTVDDAKAVARRYRDAIQAIPEEERLGASPHDIQSAIYAGKRNTDPTTLRWNALRAAEKAAEQGFPNIEPWQRVYRVAQFTNKEQDWGVVPARRGGYTLFAQGLKTKEEAIAKAKELYEQRGAKAEEEGGKLPTRPHLDKLSREGPDIRGGRDIKSTKEFKSEFGFRDAEWGNWVKGEKTNAGERQKIVNLAWDALHDLARVLNIPPKALSLNGTLALAFGARGHGGRAAAHYESGRLVINLTRISGAGTLAHEWGHALDHYLGELNSSTPYGGAVQSVSGWDDKLEYGGARYLQHVPPRLRKAAATLMNSLFKREESDAEVSARYAAKIAKAEKALKNWTNHRNDTIKRLQQKQKVGQSLKKIDDGIAYWQRDLDHWKKAEDGVRQQVETEFYKNAKKLSGKSGAKGYWARPTELFARSMESYVFDKLAAEGHDSQYLVQGVEPNRFGNGYKGNPYPAGEERDAINAAYDRLFKSLQTGEGKLGKGTKLEGAPGEPEAAPVRTRVKIPKITSEEKLDQLKDEMQATAAASEEKPAMQRTEILSDGFASHFRDGKGFASIAEARKFAKDAGFELNDKEVDEAVELGAVKTAREIAAKADLVPDEAFRALVNLYSLQPTLDTRTGTSIANQAYSTPVPLAYVASRLADVRNAKVVYEPTAGNGALLIEAAPEGTIANEIDPARAEALKAQGFITTTKDATELTLKPESVDSIVMNPPFGQVYDGGKPKTFGVDAGQNASRLTTNSVDHVIALQALKALKDDGKAVAILGGLNPKNETVAERRAGYRAKSKREFFYHLYNNYNVTDHFTVAGDLYGKQGTGWPVDVVVINGRGKSDRQLPAASPPPILSTWDQISEKLPSQANTGAAIPGRTPAEQGSNAPGATPGGLQAPNGGPGGSGGDAGGAGLVSGTGPESGTDSIRVRGGPDRGQPGTPGIGAKPETQLRPAGERNSGRPNQPSPAGGDSDLDIRSFLENAVKEEFAAPEPKTRTTPEVAKSAIKNVADAAEEGMKALDKLFNPKGKLSGGLGPTFDEKSYQEAKPHFTAAANKFSQFAHDLAELARRLIAEMRRAFGWTQENIKAALPYLERFLQDVRDGVIKLRPKTNEAGQTPYLPASRTKAFDSLTPANMAESTQRALANLEERRGPVDAYVTKELGYSSDADGPYFMRDGEKQRPFSAEQIDSIGLALDNVQKGDALILGDQTGVGKGRVNGSMIIYAMKHDMVPVFVTKSPDLFGDMYRDLTDIGFQEMFGREPRMFMTNVKETVPLDEEAVAWKQDADEAKANGEKIPKERGRFLTSGGGAAVNKGMQDIADRKGDHDMVFTTYNQMQTTQGREPERRRFLRSVAPRAFFVLDEAHNAGGQTASGWSTDAPANRAEFARELLMGSLGNDHSPPRGRARAVMYSSATYAKNPDVMDLYGRTDMAKSVDDLSHLAALIQKGGVPLQQAVAAMLAKGGQYVRRERSFEGINYEPVPVEIDDKSYRDFSGSIRSIFDFDKDGDLEDIRKDFMKETLDHIGGTTVQDNSVGRAGARVTAFNSVMHNAVNQMLLSIKANATAKEAIEAFKRGEKPVIALANTMASFISDFAKDQGINVGDPIDLGFDGILQRYLRRTLRITIKHIDGRIEHVFIPADRLSPRLQRMYHDAQDAIDAGTYKGLPVSPIDWLRHKMETAGLKVGEITGRHTMMDYSTSPPTYIARPRKELGSAGKRTSVAAFNRGDLDSLIINESGSTGLSAHASRTFKDQRQRHMMILQANPNIDTHMQTLGRINREGQVVLPRYSHITADIPAEARPVAILMKKMASLNANTTAARKSNFMSGDATDFMNQYGDRIVAEIMDDDPDLNHSLGTPVEHDENGRLKVEGAAKKVTGHLTLLPVEEQAALIDNIQNTYKDLIDRLDAMGENELEAKTMDLGAKTLDSTPLKPRTGPSPFEDGVNVEKISAKAQGRAMSMDDIAADVGQELHTQDLPGSAVAKLAQLERIGRQQVETKIETFSEQAIAWFKATLPKNPMAQLMTARKNAADLARWQETMRITHPGARVVLTGPDGDLPGVVTKLARTGKAKSPIALGSWQATIAVPNAARTFAFPLSQLYPPSVTKADNQPGTQIRAAGYTNQHTELEHQFEEARKEGREDRYMVTGNILSGYDQMGGGRITNYTTDTGELKPGVLMPRSFDLSKFLQKRAIRLKTADQIKAFLDQAPNALVSSTDGQVELGRRYGNWLIEVAAARRMGGRYYTDPAVREAVGTNDFFRHKNYLGIGNRQVMRTELGSVDKFNQAVDAMIKVGARFVTKESQDIAQGIVGGAAPTTPDTFAQLPQVKPEYQAPSDGELRAMSKEHLEAVYSKIVGNPYTSAVFGSKKAAYEAVKSTLDQAIIDDIAKVLAGEKPAGEPAELTMEEVLKSIQETLDAKADAYDTKQQMPDADNWHWDDGEQSWRNGIVWVKKNGDVYQYGAKMQIPENIAGAYHDLADAMEAAIELKKNASTPSDKAIQANAWVDSVWNSGKLNISGTSALRKVAGEYAHSLAPGSPMAMPFGTLVNQIEGKANTDYDLALALAKGLVEALQSETPPAPHAATTEGAEWVKNAVGKWAWMKDGKQISGAFPSWDDWQAAQKSVKALAAVDKAASDSAQEGMPPGWTLNQNGAGWALYNPKHEWKGQYPDKGAALTSAWGKHLGSEPTPSASAPSGSRDLVNWTYDLASDLGIESVKGPLANIALTSIPNGDENIGQIEIKLAQAGIPDDHIPQLAEALNAMGTAYATLNLHPDTTLKALIAQLGSDSHWPTDWEPNYAAKAVVDLWQKNTGAAPTAATPPMTLLSWNDKTKAEHNLSAAQGNALYALTEKLLNKGITSATYNSSKVYDSLVKAGLPSDLNTAVSNYITAQPVKPKPKQTVPVERMDYEKAVAAVMQADIAKAKEMEARGIPMDLEAINQRRQELGSTTPAWKGVTSNIFYRSFNTKRKPTDEERAAFFSNKPSIASSYAEGGQYSRTYPVWLRTKGFKVVDWKGKEYSHAGLTEELDRARDEGFPGVAIHNISDVGGSDQIQYAVFDMTAIRSKFARFDLDERHSSDIMAQLGPPPDASGGLAPSAPPSSGAFLRPQLKLTGAKAKELADTLAIISRIAGPNVSIELHDTLSREQALGSRQAADIKRLEASGSKFAETAGGFYKPGRSIDGDALIGVAMNDPQYDPRTSAGHEGYHHFETAYATDAELKLLNSPSEMERMRRYAAPELGLDPEEITMPPYEIRATAFQRYRREREEGMDQGHAGAGLHIGVRRFFDKIYQLLQRVVNALRGLGYKTFDDIFERARTGEARQGRQVRPLTAERWAQVSGENAPRFASLKPIDATKEHITEVAVRDPDTGRIWSAKGVLHSELAEQAASDLDLPENYMDPFEDGFLTSTGRFVDREEAVKVAQGAGQLKGKPREDDRAQWVQTEDLRGDIAPEEYRDAPDRFASLKQTGAPPPPSGHNQPGGLPSLPPIKGRGKAADTYIRNVQPELMSDKALQADARFAKYNAQRQILKDGPTKRYEAFAKAWDPISDKDRIDFLNKLEHGDIASMPDWQKEQAMEYRRVFDLAHKIEQKYGSTAAYVEDYAPHLWKNKANGKNAAQAREFFREYIKSLGPTWFQKPRTFDLIKQGLAAGFELRTTNPTELVLHRLYASADMIERVKLLQDLRDDYGMAIPAKNAEALGHNSGHSLIADGWAPINAPDRQRWLLAPDIQPLWKNSVEAVGLWSNPGMVGDVFRGWMHFKNVWVPVRLAMTLFHPMHILQINMAQDMARMTGQFASGDYRGGAKSLTDIVAGPVKAAIPGVSHLGKDARAAWLKPKEDRTPTEQFMVQRFLDGGFVPQMSEELKIGAKRALSKALAQQDWWRVAPAATKRLIEKMQAPIFEHWIPNLKAAAYINDTNAFFAKHPEKLTDVVQYRAALRAIAQQVDRRFGQMNYSTLYWNKTLKDAAIGSLLSLGWQLSLVGGYVAPAFKPIGRAYKAARGEKQSETQQTIREAQNGGSNLAAYVVISMATAALLQKALTDDWPSEFIDYIFPPSGGKNPDGTKRRRTTMSFLRDIPMLEKHIESRQGYLVERSVRGFLDFVWNKALASPFIQMATNQDYFGADIRDPDADILTQAKQLLKYLGVEELDPISVSGAMRGIKTGGSWQKEVPLSVLGFGPAPAYASRTAMENKIAAEYYEYGKPARTPHDEAELAARKADTRNRLFAAQQIDPETGAMTDPEAAKIAKQDLDDLHGKVYKDTLAQYQFSRLPASRQRALLEEMTTAERKVYFPKASRILKQMLAHPHPSQVTQ